MNKSRRLIVNNDFYNIFQVEPPVTEQDVLDAVDKLVGTQVDSLTVDAPVGVLDGSILDPDLTALYLRPDADQCLANLVAFAAGGRDPFQLLLSRAHDAGLEFLASFRMNDTHYKDQPFHPWLDQFYYDHLHQRLGPANGRQNTEFDYRQTEVREYYLGQIRTALERYDVDGVELNFTRNCRLFPQPLADECAPVLTQFIRQVRQLADEWGRRRGRRLVVGALVPYSPYRCRQEGLDLPVWARLGLVDWVGLLTPFLADFSHDVADARLKLPGVQVYAGCDRNLGFSFSGESRVVPLETYRAMTMNYRRQGVDGIYLFNVMSWTMNWRKANAAVKRDGGQGETTGAPLDYDRQLLNELGDLQTLAFLDKLYLIAPGPEAPDRPGQGLPATVPANGEVTFRLTVGDDAAAAAGRLAGVWLQTISSDCADYNNYTVKLNGVDLARGYAFVPFADQPKEALLFPEPGRRGTLPPLAKVRRHPVRPIDLHPGVNFVTVKSYRDALTITDVELAIRYRPG